MLFSEYFMLKEFKGVKNNNCLFFVCNPTYIK